MSLFTGLQMESALAGIVVMSGYLPATSQCQVQQKSVPIWHGHGTLDPLVQIAMAQRTKERLTQEMGVENYKLVEFPIQHTFSPEEIQQVMQFLITVLPADDTCKIKLKYPIERSVKELKAAARKAGLSTVGLMEKSEFVKLLQEHRSK